MSGKFFLFLAFLLLLACKPNKPSLEQADSTTTISIEQQKQDALALQKAEDSLKEAAQLELSQIESNLLQNDELESQHNEQMLLDMAASQQAKLEADLINRAKLESDKTQAQLDQATIVKKDIFTPIPN